MMEEQKLIEQQIKIQQERRKEEEELREKYKKRLEELGKTQEGGNLGLGLGEASGRAPVLHGTSDEKKNNNNNENDNKTGGGTPAPQTNINKHEDENKKENGMVNTNCDKLLNTFNLKFYPNKGSLIGFLEAFKSWIRRMEKQGGEISDEDQGVMLMACLSDTARTAVQGRNGFMDIQQQLKDCFLRDKITLKTDMNIHETRRK